MKKIFKNKNSKIRSGWKIFFTLCSFYIITMIASIPITFISTIYSTFNGNLDIISYDIVNMQSNIYYLLMIIQNIVMITLPLIIWKFIEKKEFKQMGLENIKFHTRDLTAGLLLGAISMIIVFAGIISIGDGKMAYSLINPKFSVGLISNLILFILVGFAEEIFGRAYIMSTLKQTKNIYITVIVSSIIFSLLHSGNPNVSLIAYLNIFLVGVLFAYMYIKSGNIWMSIGYHITWNYFQGNIFGFQVSGLESQGIYQTNILSQNILNGGDFGPEGGLIVTVVIILGLLFTKILSQSPLLYWWDEWQNPIN